LRALQDDDALNRGTPQIWELCARTQTEGEFYWILQLCDYHLHTNSKIAVVINFPESVNFPKAPGAGP